MGLYDSDIPEIFRKLTVGKQFSVNTLTTDAWGNQLANGQVLKYLYITENGTTASILVESLLPLVPLAGA